MNRPLDQQKTDPAPVVGGLDLGSNTIKLLLLGQSRRIIDYDIVPATPGNISRSRELLADLVARSGLGVPGRIVSTGYGRRRAEYADGNVSEITAHARGAHFLFPQARTVIDIGGQDAKVIALDESGRVEDFVLNDRCAAGTGRFLEVMARALELSLEELADPALAGDEPVQISSQCTVFAESEIISALSRGRRVEDIVAGLNRALASRVVQLVRQVGGRPPLVFQGGVAKNKGLTQTLEAMLGAPLTIYREPQLVGALGAALMALEPEGPRAG